MVQSIEREFVTNCFIEISNNLSRSKLYGYREADRGGFDFACLLTLDRSRALVGQTLTRHAEGIEKDLNWLLFAEDVEIPVYLYSYSTRNESRVQEVLHRASRQLPHRTGLVRLFKYPSDFDADKEEQRDLVYDILRNRIVDDLVLNILFDNLTTMDIDLFLNGAGVYGLLLSVLEIIATKGFVNFPSLARDLGNRVHPSTLRPRLQHLVTSGMLETLLYSSVYRLTQRARVFLQICGLITEDCQPTPELAFTLDHLQLDIRSLPEGFDQTFFVSEFGHTPPERTLRLLQEIIAAKQSFGISVSGGPYGDDPQGLMDKLPGDQIWIGR